MTSVRILLVEDEAIVQLDVQRQLRRLGHSVVGVASSGEEAVAKASELLPDLVLMDVRLDGSMDGVEAARRIRAFRDIPILFVTAYSNAGEAEAATPSARLEPRLGKPFRSDELEAALTRVLTGPRRNPEER